MVHSCAFLVDHRVLAENRQLYKFSRLVQGRRARVFGDTEQALPAMIGRISRHLDGISGRLVRL